MEMESNPLAQRMQKLNFLSGLLVLNLIDQGHLADEAITLVELLNNKYPDWEQPNTVVIFCHLEKSISEVEVLVLDAERYAHLFPPMPEMFNRRPNDALMWTLGHYPRHLERCAFVPIEPLRKILRNRVDEGLAGLNEGTTPHQ
jgi:hypothetical protein